MIQRDNILQELQALDSKLLSNSFTNVYSVPARYFEKLPALVLRRIRAMETADAGEELAELSPLLHLINRATPYQAPAGYFETLETGKIPVSDVQAELKELSPLLSGLKRQTPYEVPAGYFANLDHGIPAQKAPARVISFNRGWLRYAVAAVIVTFIGIGGFLFLNRKNIDPEQQSHAWVEKNIKDIPTNELDEFIETTDNTAPVIAATDRTNEIRELMKSVSDQELQDFLQDAEAIETSTTN